MTDTPFPAPAPLVVHGDVLCPWSTVIVLPIVHRAMPLELLYERPVARRVVDAEIPLCASLTPDFGWALWQGRADEYPVTSLLALEAVAAARAQSLLAGEQLDLALRRAFFTRSRCISMRHEVLAAAATCDAVDLGALASALDHGTSRATISREYAEARSAGVQYSGTVTLPDGTMSCNPGTEVRWIGGPLPSGTPVLDSDLPETYDDLVATALAASGRRAPVPAVTCRSRHTDRAAARG